MRSVFCIFLMTAPAFAQDARVARGESIFATNCSVPYCHGANGALGRAPKLIGHNFTAQELTSIVSSGIANKGMPAFGGRLSSDDLEAVIGYVLTLRGSSPGGTGAAPVRTVVQEAPGKALFFDAVRLGGCGRCHELEKRGSPVADAIKNVPGDLRTVNATHTVTVSAKDETSFPGIVREQTEKRVRVFDLSSHLPVLRTFARDAVEVKPGSPWSHGDAIGKYSDTELRAIAEYLRSIVGK